MWLIFIYLFILAHFTQFLCEQKLARIELTSNLFFLSLKICRTHQHNGCKSIVNDPVTHVELLISDPDQQQRRNSRILTSLRLLTIRSPPFLLPPRAVAYGHKRAELHDAQPIGGSSTLIHLLLNANIPAPAQ